MKRMTCGRSRRDRRTVFRDTRAESCTQSCCGMESQREREREREIHRKCGVQTTGEIHRWGRVQTSGTEDEIKFSGGRCGQTTS
eukprot:2519046-Karenia_brevis.AAC.1